MSETENADDEETLSKDAYDSESIGSDDLKTSLKNQILSFARQFLCFCSVVMFPILSSLYKNLRAYEYVDTCSGCEALPDREEVLEKLAASDRAYEKDSMKVTVIAVISSVLLLYWLGRRLTVAIANLLQFLVSLYTHVILIGLDDSEKLPCNISLANVFVIDLSNVAYHIYLAEISSTTYRAFFLGLYVFAIAMVDREIYNFVNTVIIAPSGNIIAPKITPMYRNCAIVTCFSFLLTLLLPDTPFSAILKGKPEKAEATFRWLRSADPDTLEFNQMIAKAESIKINRISRRLVSQTFILGLIFSVFLMISNFNTCSMLETVIEKFYYPGRDLSAWEMNEVYDIIYATTNGARSVNFYGVTLFLVFSFVVPRKIIFLMSYVSSFLMITTWITTALLQLLFLDPLIKTLSHCGITNALGLTELVLILPVEIYPATLREVGVAISTFLSRLNRYFFYFFLARPDRYFPLNVVNYEWNYTCFFGSFFAFPLMLLFMPETKNYNMFELDKLDLRVHLPFIHREERPADEDIDTEEGSE